jgi:hypothetical protein
MGTKRKGFPKSSDLRLAHVFSRSDGQVLYSLGFLDPGGCGLWGMSKGGRGGFYQNPFFFQKLNNF